MNRVRPSLHVASLVCCGAAAAALAVPLIAAEPPKRISVPDAADRARAVKLAAEVYEKEFQNAKTSADQAALARKLLEQAAQTTDDPPGHYVLLRIARDIAAGAGELDIALDAIDRMQATYAIDGPAMRTEWFLKTAKAARTAEQRDSVARRSLSMVADAIGRDDFAGAGQIVEAAVSAARDSRDRRLLELLTARREEIRQIEEAYAEIKDDLEKLKAEPVNPEANLAVGRYYCFWRGDWQRGIPMLVLGGDPKLSEFAENELKGPATAEDQLALADGWWDMAETHEGRTRREILLHAGDWYRKAQPGLSSNLARMKAEKRLKQIEELGAGQSTGEPPRKPEEPPRELTVLRAKFGAYDGWADVTAQMQAEVRDSRLAVPKAGEGLGDPAFGHSKVLIMVVAYRGKYFLVYVPAAEPFVLPITPQLPAAQFKHLRMKQLAYHPRRDGESKLMILDAQWGAYKGWLDVTQAASAAVADSKLEVSNAGYGLKDSAPGHHKALVIVYATLGEIHIATVPAQGAATIP